MFATVGLRRYSLRVKSAKRFVTIAALALLSRAIMLQVHFHCQDLLIDAAFSLFSLAHLDECRCQNDTISRYCGLPGVLTLPVIYL